MKLAKLAAIVAGAAQVIAVPLVMSPPETEHTVRVHVVAAPYASHGIGESTTKVPCGGRRLNRFHQKSVEISNLFRQVLGLPLIHAGGHHGHANSKAIRPIFPSVGDVPVSIFAPTVYDSKGIKVYGVTGRVQNHGPAKMPDGPHHGHHKYLHHNHKHHGHHHLGKGPFISRIQYSLTNLGRWEGRAVAFVLGCGIGVLLRMFWVLAVVMYRAVRGQRDDEHEYSQITIIEEVVDTPKSAPPTYTYPVDEKVAIPAEVEAVKVPSATEESK